MKSKEEKKEEKGYTAWKEKPYYNYQDPKTGEIKKVYL